MEIVMPKLIYCYLNIFGSDFDAASFSVLDGVPKGDIVHQKSAAPKLRSPVEAIRQGNVVSWKTDKRYFSKNGIDNYEIFHDYLYEEDFLINFLNDHMKLRKLLKPFENETTEIWLVAIYEASLNDRPSGIHLGSGLIMALSNLNCSFSTDIDFSDSE
jgi:hypothetical protein